jgi:putative transposase
MTAEDGSAGDRRKRMRRREVPNGVRFVTFSCYRRMALLGTGRLRDAFVGALAGAHAAGSFDLYAWVVMPEHVHLMVRPRVGGAWAPVAAGLKTSFARLAIGRWRELGAPVLARLRQPDGSHRFWQRGGGFDRNVRDLNEFQREVRYIHRNPVERGLAADALGWRWSSAAWWAGHGGELACDPPPEPDIDWGAWAGYL